MGSSLLVSVVIPTYQRRALLERALGALARQEMSAGQYEVIVSVDGSDDGTREMLAAFEAPYSLVWCWHPNVGRAISCNRGIAMTSGELIVLLDDDMEPTPGFLRAHAAEHRTGARRGVVGAAPIVTDDASTPIGVHVGARFNRHLAHLAMPGYRFGIRDFYSGNFSIPRRLLQEVGGFDEAFTIYGHEDVELAWRLRAAGIELGFSAAAVARQRYTKDFPALARDTIANGRTAVQLATKHPSTSADVGLPLHGSNRASRRVIIAGLLALTRALPRTPDLIIRATDVLGRVRPPGLSRIYSLVLDYLYFVGAASARGSARQAEQARADIG
jgi:GT2 family glycosyltransferase